MLFVTFSEKRRVELTVMSRICCIFAALKKERMAYNVIDIAKKMIKMADDDIANGGDNITNLKLQKLLYYQQGYHLAAFDAPLFNEDVEAWIYGPVVPVVYDYYQQFGATSLPVSQDVIILDDDEESLFYQVYDMYREFSAIGLMNKTHAERPWMSVQPHNRGTIIPQSVMKSYFKTQLCEY